MCFIGNAPLEISIFICTQLVEKNDKEEEITMKIVLGRFMLYREFERLLKIPCKESFL